MANQSAFTVGGGSGGGSGTQIVVSVTQVAHGLSEGDIIRSNGNPNEFTQAQANTAANAEVTGIVTGVIDVDNFTYSKDIMNYAGAGIPAGTEGNAVFLSPSTPGVMTMTEPSSAGQVVKPIGILISSGSLLNFSSDIRGEILSTSSGVTDSELKVGVGGITDVNWFNIQYPFVGPSGATQSYNIWDMNNNSSVESLAYIDFANQEYVKNNSTVGDYDHLLPDFDQASNGYEWDSTKIAIFQIVIITATTAAGQNLAGVGFELYGAGTIRSDQGVSNDPQVGFVRRDADGQWFTHVSDGVGFTENAITLADNTKYVLRAEYDPGNATPQARFYVDGVLVDTITTDLPTAVTNPVGFCVGNGGGANDLGIAATMCPSFAVEI